MKVFSFIYWGLFAVSLPIFFIPAILIWLVTLPFDRRGHLLHMYTSVWGAFYVKVNPLWRMQVTGREKLPGYKPGVIVANHASLIDILVLYGLMTPFKWVSKESNFRLPIIGWLMRMNRYIALVRGDRESTLKMMNACHNWLKRGVPVLFFPEGTRSRDGELQAFKEGAFKLATDAGCPIYPVAITGTATALPKHGMVLRENVDAKVTALEPIDPKDFESPAALKDAAREAIQAALSAEARAR